MKGFTKVILMSLLTLSAVAKAYAATIPVEVLAFHNSINSTECDMTLTQGADVYALDQKATLVLMPCSRAAYQTAYVGYMMDPNKNVSSIVVLSWEGFLTASHWLTEASYDPATGMIYTFAKARGIGDCGEYASHKVIVDEYGYVTVKTVEISSQECLNDVPLEDVKMDNWPVVFAQ